MLKFPKWKVYFQKLKTFLRRGARKERENNDVTLSAYGALTHAENGDETQRAEFLVSSFLFFHLCQLLAFVIAVETEFSKDFGENVRLFMVSGG